MINQLKSYYVGEKIRLGNIYDGGYIVPKQVLQDSECLFSYGINNDITFDEHYMQLTNKKVYGYDHTIDGIHTGRPDLFKWYKKGLSGTPKKDTDNFLNHYKQLGISGRVLLKVDVETCEYEWLKNTDIQELANITTCLLLEVHELYKSPFKEDFIDCIEKLNEHFYLCHVHGNNYAPTFDYEGEAMPVVLELTFVPKNTVTEVSLSDESFPSDIDNPNDRSVPDIDLNFILFNRLGGIVHTIDNRDYCTVLKRALDNDGDIVDVGCYTWDWSEFFFGKKRVIGVDPIENNKLEHADLFIGVIGERNGKAYMDVDDVKSTILPIYNNTGDLVEVDMVTWKTFCNNYNIDKISVLKVNIEGSEYALLNSMDSEDFDKIDQIAISFHDWLVPEWKQKTEESLALLKKFGFNLIKINKSWNWYLAYKS